MLQRNGPLQYRLTFDLPKTPGTRKHSLTLQRMSLAALQRLSQYQTNYFQLAMTKNLTAWYCYYLKLYSQFH